MSEPMIPRNELIARAEAFDWLAANELQRFTTQREAWTCIRDAQLLIRDLLAALRAVPVAPVP